MKLIFTFLLGKARAYTGRGQGGSASPRTQSHDTFKILNWRVKNIKKIVCCFFCCFKVSYTYASSPINQIFCIYIQNLPPPPKSSYVMGVVYSLGLSIYKFGLSVCLFVSNKCQKGWTDRAKIFLWDITWPQGRFMNDKKNFKFFF